MVLERRNALLGVSVILLILGGVCIGLGGNLMQLMPPQALALVQVKNVLAITCSGNDNTAICGPDAEQFPDSAWQVRWGSVDSYGSAFRWREYWYTSYRFMNKWSTDYVGDTGVAPYSVRPYCDSGLDKNSDGTVCNSGTTMLPGADNWIGYIATRTFRAGSTTGWASGQTSHVHAEFTFDDYIKVQVSINGGSWQTIAENSVSVLSVLSLAQQPITWDRDLAASDILRVRVMWAEYTGSALVNNSWDFGTVTPSCDIGEDIFAYDLVDASHGTQSNIKIHDASAKYDVDSTFTIKARLLQSGCSGIITKVPVSLHTTGYDRTPNHEMIGSGTVWQVTISSLAAGIYYLNIGVETSSGTQWGLAVMTLAMVEVGGTVTPSQGFDWFSQVRILGYVLVCSGIVIAAFLILKKEEG